MAGNNLAAGNKSGGGRVNEQTVECLRARTPTHRPDSSRRPRQSTRKRRVSSAGRTLPHDGFNESTRKLPNVPQRNAPMDTQRFTHVVVLLAWAKTPSTFRKCDGGTKCSRIPARIGTSHRVQAHPPRQVRVTLPPGQQRPEPGSTADGHEPSRKRNLAETRSLALDAANLRTFEAQAGHQALLVSDEGVGVTL